MIMLLLCFLSSAQAEELGKLFFTPEERMRLENSKSQSSSPEAFGKVEKKGGGETVWKNGIPVYHPKEKK